MKDLQISFIVKIGFRTAISKKRVWVGLPHKWGVQLELDVGVPIGA
jgi:hypothetical protein